MGPVFSEGDFQQFSRFDHDELLRVYRFLLVRLRLESGTGAVVSVRLPPQVVDRIKMLAFAFKTSRSDVVRRAIDELVKRNPLQT